MSTFAEIALAKKIVEARRKQDNHTYESGALYGGISPSYSEWGRIFSSQS